MRKRNTVALRAHPKRVLAASFLVLGLAAAAAAFAIGYMGELYRRLADPVDGAGPVRVHELVQALAWTQAISVGALSLTSGVLFGLAWYLRQRLIAPLENLRRALKAAAAGATAAALCGIERKDEIGAVARAAEKLRQAADIHAARTAPQLHLDVLERLAKSAGRLESDLSKVATATSHARLRIEQAGLRAARASHAAIEAAALARDGATRMAHQTQERMDGMRQQSRTVIDSLVETVARLSDAAAQLERRTSDASRHTRSDLGGSDPAAVLEELACGLDAIERFARDRPALANDQLVALSAALLKAVERLNRIADTMPELAGDRAIRAAE